MLLWSSISCAWCIPIGFHLCVSLDSLLLRRLSNVYRLDSTCLLVASDSSSSGCHLWLVCIGWIPLISYTGSVLTDEFQSLCCGFSLQRTFLVLCRATAHTEHLIGTSYCRYFPIPRLHLDSRLLTPTVAAISANVPMVNQGLHQYS